MRKLRLLVCAVTLAWAPVTSAEVSPAAKATAEVLFDDALSLMKAGSFEQACPKLETSQRMDPAIGTLLYLGECYEKTGRAASAWVTFREAAALGRSLSQVQRANVAQARADQLQPQLARLTVEVSSQARALPGLQVRFGTMLLDPAVFGTSMPVDPGEVTVEATAPGHAPFSTKVRIDARGTGVVSVPALVPVPAAAQPSAAVPGAPSVEPAAAPVSEPAAAAGPRRGLGAVPIVLGSAGIIGLGIGTYFGVKAISDASAARDQCPGNVCQEAEGKTLMDSADSAATVSNVAMSLGLVSLGSGLLVYFLQSSKETPQTALNPWFGPDSAGIELKGRL
jgi:serine/threonine-protein kinase